MLKPYFGEFLIIPMPIELSLERCSNNCVYCFSNLNNYRLKTSLQSIYNHITDFSNRNDQASRLLKLGYPICVSNRTDPFCAQNYRNSIAMIETMAAMEIDIAFQTKTGPGIDEILGFLVPSCWYVSISFDDDELCKRIEPGAPPILERLKTVEKLVSHGHWVSIGVNPYVYEWIRDKKGFLSRIKEAGAYGLFVEGLHFSAEQRKRLKPGIIDSKIIERTIKKGANALEQADYEIFRDLALDMGFEFFSFYNDRATNYWAPYKQRYKCFPTITDFINHCFENKADFDTIGFNEFAESLGSFPDITYKIDSYLLTANRSFKDVKIPVYGSIMDLLKVYWTDYRLPVCPINHKCFARVADWDEKEQVYRVEEDLPIYMFKRDGWGSFVVNKEGKEV